MIIQNGLISHHDFKAHGDLVERGRQVMEQIDQRIASTREDDWKPGERPREGVQSFTRRDFNPNPGEVDAQYHDPVSKQQFSVHLSYDPATGEPSSFHQSVRKGCLGGNEQFLMQLDDQGRKTYEYAGTDGKGMRVVVDSKRDVLAIIEGEVAPFQGPGSVPADATPVSRAELSSRLSAFKLPIDSDLHHTYRNQPWFLPVLESFMQKLGQDIGTDGTINPAGFYLQSKLTLDGTNFGSVPNDNTFGGIKSIPDALTQELPRIAAAVASPGFTEAFRGVYAEAELGLKKR